LLRGRYADGVGILRGRANRWAGFLADRNGRHVGGDRHARPTARSAGNAFRIVRILLGTAERTPVTTRVLAHVGLADKNRPRFAQTLPEGRVMRWPVIRVECVGSGRRAHVKGIKLVFNR